MVLSWDEHSFNLEIECVRGKKFGGGGGDERETLSLKSVYWNNSVYSI